MSYKQLVKPNIAINENAGWCLSYARRVFGRPAIEATAWQAWANTKFKHKDRKFPKGVSFPVWFDHWGDYGGGWAQYGHVAVVHTDGKVWSSPLSGKGRAWFASVDDLVRTFAAAGSTMTYVGWSEDISGARVIEPVKEVNVIADTEANHRMWSKLRQLVLGSGISRADFSKVYAGKSYRSRLDAIVNHSQAGAHVTQLEKQLADVRNALANEKAKPPREVVKEVEKIVEKEVFIDRPVGEEEAVRGFFQKLLDLIFKK